MQYRKTEGRKWGHQDPRNKADNSEGGPQSKREVGEKHVSLSGYSKIREVICNMIVTLE